MVGGKRAEAARRRDREAVDKAVVEAERRTGLQFCVYLGPSEGDPHAQAERMFVEAGLAERPAVLLLVAPNRRRVEVVTAAGVRERLTDEACAQAIEAMTPHFAAGDYADGLVVGLRRLAESAGPGRSSSATDLPNVLGE